MADIFKNSPTFRLFKKEPSFWNGVASLIDIKSGFSRYNVNSSETEADKKALRADWLAIGQDLWNAIQEYEREQQRAVAK